MAKVNTHGLKMIGLKKASGSTKKLWILFWNVR